MKKMILLLAVALMTAPAMATVTITVTDDGDGWARINYSHDQGANFVRAFALDITADTANIVAVDSNHPAYWVYPGSIDINDAGGVNDVGSPVAAASYPGTLGGLDTNGITIEMGALFEAGVDPDPPSSGTLLRVQVDADCTVCVNGNAIRGNVVMKDASSAAPAEACAAITAGGGCACLGDITATVGVGAPDGKVDLGDLQGLLIAMMTAYPTGDPTGLYDLGSPPSPAGMECIDLTTTVGVGAPDGKVDLGDLQGLLIAMMTAYPTGDPTGLYTIPCQ